MFITEKLLSFKTQSGFFPYLEIGAIGVLQWPQTTSLWPNILLCIKPICCIKKSMQHTLLYDFSVTVKTRETQHLLLSMQQSQTTVTRLLVARLGVKFFKHLMIPLLSLLTYYLVTSRQN